MAAFEVLALDPTTPQIRAPGAADTYSFPRAAASNLGTLNTTITPSNTLINTTAATAIQDQISPSLRFTSNGWKTNATAASQTDSVDVFLYPASAPTSPSAQLRFIPTINGSAVPGLAITGSISGNGVLTGTYLTGFDGVNSFGGNNLAGFCGFGPAGGANTFALYSNANSQISFGNGFTTLGSTHNFGWGSTSTTSTIAPDTVLTRDAANTLAQRNGTNAQTFRIYNTFTDASNYERAALQWSGNALQFITEGAGTGSGRNIGIYPTGNVSTAVGFTTNGIIIQAGTQLIFTPSAGNPFASGDAGLRRTAAGVLSASDGSTGVGYLRTPATTVASLLSAATAGAGARAFVTDATVTIFLSTVAGGGANKVPVVSDGTNWLIG